MANLPFKFTAEGWAKFMESQNSDVELLFTHLIFGDSAHEIDTPTGQVIINEIERVPISNKVNISPQQKRISATFTGDFNYWVKEIGLIADGVLAAVYSSADANLYYRQTGVPFTLPLDFGFVDLPANSINFVTEPLSAALQFYVDESIAEHESNGNHVRYDIDTQGLTEAQRTNARTNIDVFGSPAWSVYTSPARVGGVTYTNTSSRPMWLAIYITNSTGGSTGGSVTLRIAKVDCDTYEYLVNPTRYFLKGLVPPNTTYSVLLNGGSITYWGELV